MFFYTVNLPLAGEYVRQGYPEIFLQMGINPEIGLDNIDFRRSELDFSALSARFADMNARCTAHLPFMDVEMASADEKKRQEAVSILKSAMDVAKIFNPHRLVAHAWIQPDDVHGCIKRAALSLRELDRHWPGHPCLCVENVFEQDPAQLRDLILAVDRDNFGLCFDIGHWHAFARGAEKRNLAHWLETFAPHLRHAHLHDNDGTSDQHLGLGQGRAPLEDFLGFVKQMESPPTITFEPHSEQDFKHTLKFMRDNPQCFDWEPKV